jgi:hypothetical protein
MIVNYNRIHSFIVLATVIMIVIYDYKNVYSTGHRRLWINHPIFIKSSQNNFQSNKCQNISTKAQFESPKQLHPFILYKFSKPTTNQALKLLIKVKNNFLKYF